MGSGWWVGTSEERNTLRTCSARIGLSAYHDTIPIRRKVHHPRLASG